MQSSAGEQLLEDARSHIRWYSRTDILDDTQQVLTAFLENLPWDGIRCVITRAWDLDHVLTPNRWPASIAQSVPASSH